MKSVFLVSLCIFLSLPLFAQRNLDGKTEFIYRKEFSVGARINTNGWTVFGETAKILNIHKTRVLQFELTAFKHPKERKQSIPFSSSSRNDFIFGKQNNFFAFHANYGFKKQIADKARKSGVRLSMTYLAGVSLGILKPYYIEIDKPRTSIKYTGENEEVFLNVQNITGASGFKKGIGEIEPVPGAHGKFGLNFDWASHDEILKAMEIGISADIYYKIIPIMVTENNKPYMINFYLGVQFGKRS
ncbi:MAG: hypothetical protein HKN92_08395 [Chitinophagales bacterium]|nr:hypothetical protein [Chitinophagales bacterium]